MDRRDFKYWLITGTDYINGCLKDGVTDDKRDSLYKDFHKLEKDFYALGESRLSMTDLLRLETRLRATKKRLDKRFS